MPGNDKIKEIKNRVRKFIDGDIIKINCKAEHIDFFLSNSRKSFSSAKLLCLVSSDEKVQKKIDYEAFDGYLWVINASYYSMFYMVRALLEGNGIKLSSDQSIHSLAYDALIYFFYITGKLEKSLIEDLAEAGEEASELLGQNKAKELIQDYLFEKNKRATFTYHTSHVAIRRKAKTSLNRARRFNEEINKMIDILHPVFSSKISLYL